MTTFWKTSNNVDMGGHKSYELIFGTKPFYQINRRFKLGFCEMLGFKGTSFLDFLF